MCWIFAYVGKSDCRSLLLHALRDLEYRGYDSAGMVCINENNKIFLEKAVWRVSALAHNIDARKADTTIYSCGIAHTRWATHGGVTRENTHPHSSSRERFFIVHNGIIENYKELKKELEWVYSFSSDTDTEVVIKLVEHLYDGSLKSTLQKVAKRLVGAYSLAIIDRENPKEIVAMKLGSPLVVGVASQSVFLSSDIQALSQLTDRYTVLEDHEIVVIHSEKYDISMFGKTVDREAEKLESHQKAEALWNFTTYTEKEIFDIPSVLENVFSWRIHFGRKEICNETLETLWGMNIERICVVSSGSSYYAGDVGTYFFRKFAGIPAQAIISSEFLADSFIPDMKTLYIFLSQSGETADVRECMKIVQAKWCMSFGIVNVVGSSIARMADIGLYSHAGVERWVASTKNVIAQLAVMLMMSLSLGAKHDMQISEIRDIISELHTLPDMIHKVLRQKEYIRTLAEKYAKYNSMFVLGRNYFYPAAGEAALKCKELSYIHCESYSAGELKHGPLALVGEDFPVIVFNPMGKFHRKTVSNIQEILARKAPILGYISHNDSHKELYTDTIELPESSELISLFTWLTASYLFALYTAEFLGRDIDKPRNLAKSVTVE